MLALIYKNVIRYANHPTNDELNNVVVISTGM